MDNNEFVLSGAVSEIIKLAQNAFTENRATCLREHKSYVTAQARHKPADDICKSSREPAPPWCWLGRRLKALKEK
jgi:hypothetical protein